MPLVQHLSISAESIVACREEQSEGMYVVGWYCRSNLNPDNSLHPIHQQSWSTALYCAER